MSKMVKLSDAVGYSLSKRAEEDNLSMASEVAKLLATTELPPQPTDTEYFDKKFDELKALIEDTTVDRVAGGRAPMDPAVKRALARKDIDWPIVQDLIYEFLDERAPEWFPGAYKGVHNMDVDVDCYTKDEVLYFENQITGGSWPVLHVSSRVQQFLDTHSAN